MKNSKLYYSVGALLYCPANRGGIAEAIVSGKFAKPYSLALCLEDTINDDCVYEAENTLIQTLTTLHQQKEISSFYLPKIFIRVRYQEQIMDLLTRLSSARELVTGFILPKFSLKNADNYIDAAIQANQTFHRRFYIMPIFESPTIVHLNTRHSILYTLKEKLDAVEELVLNIRVGGNDLCHIFGFRRHALGSIHKIHPIANIFADIVTVFGIDYVVSGPVWEYYNGNNWDEGMTRELEDDYMCGFIGKTVIHPNQIPLVNEALKVNACDLSDAKAILNWDCSSASLVHGSTAGERMNEYKTHYNWAKKIVFLSELYGIK